MTTIPSHRLPFCKALVIALLGTSPLFAASDDLGPWSGSYRGRILTELFLHEQSLARRAQSKASRFAPEPKGIIRPDVGNIAVIDTSGGVVVEPNVFDLLNLSVSFTRTENGYAATSGPTAFSDQSRDEGVPVSLGDDDAQEVSLPFPFPYFDQTHTQAFVHSDGNLTFEEPESSSTRRSLDRALSGPPRIAPLFSDLDPSRVDTPVSTYSTTDRFFVTWNSVPVYTRQTIGLRQTFQLVLHRDGTIDFHYRTVLISNAVVGIIPGRLEGNPTAVDLSEGASGPIEGALAEVFQSDRYLDVLASGQKFYRNHEDAYDFLVFFNSLGLEVGDGAFAFQLNIRNEVLGIGEVFLNRRIIDFGQEFGSERRLQSFMNMGPLVNYLLDLTFPILGQDNTLDIISHEAGHRFLTFIDFVDPTTGQRSNSLLGRQLAHWSFFFNSDASFLEGNRIEDQAMMTPRFLTSANGEHYSEFDQYLMGFRFPYEVTPSFLIEKPTNIQPDDFSASSRPRTGVSFDGERKEISIDMIIEAEGKRVPDASVSQRKFNFAFVLVVDEGEEPAEADIQKLETIRSEWEPYFEQATDLRADAQTELVRELHLSTWPASGLVVGVPATATVEISEARSSDLDVMLTTDNGGVTAPAVVTIPSGATSVSFALEGVTTGVTRLSAHATDPGYDNAQALIDVKGAASVLDLQVISGDDQVGSVGERLPDPIVLRVTDTNNLPYPGLRVNLMVSRDGVVTPSSAVTDASGEIRIIWRLPTDGDLPTLTAQLDDAPSVNTTVTARYSASQPSLTVASVIGSAGLNLDPASENTAVSPGGLVSIFGNGLATETLNAETSPLPTNLGGTSVTVNGIPAALLFVSPTRINLQIPFETTGETAEIIVTMPAGTSSAVVDVNQAQPGIFFDSTTGLGALVNIETGVTLWKQPLPAGATAAVFCAGLGAVEPTVGTGQPAPLNPRAETVLTVEAEIDGRSANVLFSGLAPGFSGLYQVNIKLPTDLAPGRYTLVMRAAGFISNQVFVDIE
ncbi:MAG: hypothetical protein OXB98_21985 [Bryobacterales bacterium]|nr:hypothetical protein [Bryobacterales bacterium]